MKIKKDPQLTRYYKFDPHRLIDNNRFRSNLEYIVKAYNLFNIKKREVKKINRTEYNKQMRNL